MKSATLSLAVALAVVCSGVRAANVYRIDIDSTDGGGGPIETAPGWTSLNASGVSNNATVTVDGVTFQPASADGSRVRRSGVSPNPNALTGDFVFDDGPGEAVILKFGGAGDLQAGTWQADVYINDAGAAPGTQIVGWRKNNAETIVSTSVSPHATDPAVSFQFTSDGTSAYDVFSRENNSSNRSRLNAVKLTYLEPADLNVNLGKTASSTEAGYANFFADDNVAGTHSARVMGVDITVTETGSPSNLRAIDRGNTAYAGAMEKLTESWMGTSAQGSALTVTLDGGDLVAGDYSWTSYHHDQSNQTGRMNVDVSTDGGATFQRVSSYLDITNGTSSASPSPGALSFELAADGSSDVQVRFTAADSGSANDFTVVNGFSLQPYTAPGVVLGQELIRNGSFEQRDLPSGGHDDTDPTGWIGLNDNGGGTGRVGVMHEARDQVTDTPDGEQWAHTQGDGAQMGQRIADTSWIGSAVDVSYLVSRRSNETTATNHKVQVVAGTFESYEGGTVLDTVDYDGPLASTSTYNQVELQLLPKGDPGANTHLWLVFEHDIPGGGQMLFDAVSAAMAPAPTAPQLKVDFGSSSNTGGGPGGTQPNFVPFEDTESGGTPPVVNAYASAMGADGDVDVKISGYTHFRDYAAVTGTFAGKSPLLSDNVLRNSDGTLKLTLDDLKPGVYEITTYHHSTEYGSGTIDTRLFDAAGLNQVVANGVPVTPGTDPAAVSTQTFQFVAGGSSVVIDFLRASTSGRIALDGFELTLVQAGRDVIKTEVLALDINDRGAPGPANTQAGFQEFLLGGTEDNDFGGVTTHSYGGIDVTLTHSNGGNIGDRRRTQPTNGGDFTQQELLRDLVFARGTSAADGLDVLIEGLLPGQQYEVTLWSFDDGSPSSRLSDWFVNGGLAMDNYVFHGNDDPISDAVYSFSFLANADASGELLIGGRAAGGSNPNVFLNALRLTRVDQVPEPATMFLAAMGLSALGAYARRRRKA